MRASWISIAAFVLTTSATVYGAEEYQPDPLELAPLEPMQCKWSELSYEERKLCRKRKEFFDKMKPEEKRRYNEEVEKRRMQERIEQLDRRTR